MAKHHHIQIEKLKKANDALVEALKFYADANTDNGQKAKETLNCLNYHSQQPQQPQR